MRAPGAMPGLMLCVALQLTACASSRREVAVNVPDAHAVAPAAPAAEPQPAASQQPIAPKPIELQGQLSIKLQAFGNTPAQGVSLGFFFSGHPEAGRLDLMTPLGSQVAQVGWTTSGAWLLRHGSQAPANAGSTTHDDGLERFDSIDVLSERLLGEGIPLQTLMHWLQGHPAPEHASTIGPDSGLTAGTFTQDGWLIDTRESPRRIEALRAASDHVRGILIKVYLDH